MNKLVNVTIKWVEDDNPDLSYLDEETYYNKLRRNTYGESWYMEGCYAEAEIHIPAQQGGFSTIQRIRSGGLWGIESDSDDDYKHEIEQEQLANLKGQLEQLNVDTSNFDKLVMVVT